MPTLPEPLLVPGLEHHGKPWIVFHRGCRRKGYRTKGRTPAELFWGAVREHRHEEG